MHSCRRVQICNRAVSSIQSLLQLAASYRRMHLPSVAAEHGTLLALRTDKGVFAMSPPLLPADTDGRCCTRPASKAYQ